MLYQVKTGILFDINQSFLTIMNSIVTLCSMLIQELFFGIIFQRQLNAFILHMKVLVRLYLWNFLLSKEMNSP